MNCPPPWQRCSTSLASSVAVHPASLAKHPQRWSKDEVGVWLQWCSEEYSIETVPPEKFDLNGKALCLLSRGDFIERLPNNGDVLYNCLQTLITRITGDGVLYHPQAPVCNSDPIPTRNEVCLDSSSLPSDSIPAGLLLVSSTTSGQSPLISGTSFSTRHYVPIRPHPVFSGAICETSNLSSATKDCRLLWEFIYQLLMNSKYSGFVNWESRDDYVFRIVNPTGLAELWGQQKNRTNMTYEKLSRALRYYYRMNIIKKVPGKRLTYRFLQSPSRIQKGQRGAKPHCKFPHSTEDSASPSSQLSSLSNEHFGPEKLEYKSSLSDVKDSSSDCEEGRDENDSSSVDRDIKPRTFFNKFETNNGVSSDVDSLSDPMFPRFPDTTTYTEPTLLPVKFKSGKSPMLDVSSSKHSSAFRPIHRGFDIPVPPEVKTMKTDIDEVPPYYMPHYEPSSVMTGLRVTSCSPLPRITHMSTSALRVTNSSTMQRVTYSSPTTRVSSNVLRGTNSSTTQHVTYSSPPLRVTRTSPTKTCVLKSPFSYPVRLADSIQRSLSIDGVNSYRMPTYRVRPQQARSASPRTDVQLEPEDLSLKKKTHEKMASDVR